MAYNCSRVQLIEMAERQEIHKWLDVGIYKNRHWRVKVKTVEPVSMEAHAVYRFLLNTDGQAASWRLAKLLAINSVVLKWRSGNIEFYYRSLKSGQHFLDVDQNDLIQVMQSLADNSTNSAAQEQLKAMADRAQHFAHRYLSQLSRSAYACSALTGYRDLFGSGQVDLLLGVVRANGQASMGMAMLLQLRSQLRLHAQNTAAAAATAAAE